MLQPADGPLVALDARRDSGTSCQALVVGEVVCEICELDRARDRVARDLLDVLLIRLARRSRQGADGIHHFARQVRFAQLLGGDRGVLQDVVQHGNCLRADAADPQHHTQRMQDVGLRFGEG